MATSLVPRPPREEGIEPDVPPPEMNFTTHVQELSGSGSGSGSGPGTRVYVASTRPLSSGDWPLTVSHEPQGPLGSTSARGQAATTPRLTRAI